MLRDDYQSIDNYIFEKLNVDVFTRKLSIYKELNLFKKNNQNSILRSNFVLQSYFESTIKFVRKALNEIIFLSKNELMNNLSTDEAINLYQVFNDLAHIGEPKTTISFENARLLFSKKRFPKIVFNDIDTIYGKKLIRAIKIIGVFVKTDVSKISNWIKINEQDRHSFAHGNDILMSFRIKNKSIFIDSLSIIIELFFNLISKFINKINLIVNINGRR